MSERERRRILKSLSSRFFITVADVNQTCDSLVTCPSVWRTRLNHFSVNHARCLLLLSSWNAQLYIHMKMNEGQQRFWPLHWPGRMWILIVRSCERNNRQVLPCHMYVCSCAGGMFSWTIHIVKQSWFQSRWVWTLCLPNFLLLPKLVKTIKAKHPTILQGYFSLLLLLLLLFYFVPVFVVIVDAGETIAMQKATKAGRS